MRQTILILLGFVFFDASLLSQDYDKVYLDASDNTKYYYRVFPDIQPKGLIILLPGCRGNSEWALKTTSIPYIASDNGLVTIMIDYELWLSWLREDVLELLNTAISDAIKVHDIPKDKCVIGGFSSGGNMALSFAEFAIEDNSKTAIIPCGVFGFQPPLDLVELYSVDYQIIKGYYCLEKKERVTEEVIGINGTMTKHLGTPWDNPDNFYKYSPFLISQRYHGGGKAKYLKSIPVRIYSANNEKYFQSRIDNCGMYLPSSLFFISCLRFMGNEKATFKNQYDADYNPDGGEKFRGRHAWLGFDSKECVDWVLKTINNE